MGAVMTVVTTAMRTSMAKVVGDSTRRSSPMLSTISSIRPRVFMRTPRADDSRQGRPVRRGGGSRAPDLPAGVHENAEGGRLAPGQAGQAGGGQRAAELAGAGDSHDGAADQPLASALDEADLGPHAGEGEEDGGQKDDQHALEPVGELAADEAGVGDDDAQEEGAEDGVDADELGGEGGEQEGDEDDRGRRLRQAALGVDGAGQADDERSDDDEDEDDVGEGEEDGVRGAADARLDDADDEGEEAPGGDVVDRRAGERDAPERGSLQAA